MHFIYWYIRTKLNIELYITNINYYLEILTLVSLRFYAWILDYSIVLSNKTPHMKGYIFLRILLFRKHWEVSSGISRKPQLSCSIVESLWWPVLCLSPFISWPPNQINVLSRLVSFSHWVFGEIRDVNKAKLSLKDRDGFFTKSLT